MGVQVGHKWVRTFDGEASWGLLGPSWALLGPSWGLLGSSSSLSRPSGHKNPRVLRPKRLQDGPQRAQDGPKMAPGGSKIAPKGPKMAPRKPNLASTGPRTPPHQRSSPIFAPLGPPKGPQEPLKLDTWDPPKVTTVIRILHFFTFEAMSKQGSKVGRLKAGEEGLLHRLIPVLWVPNRPCGGG